MHACMCLSVAMFMSVAVSVSVSLLACHNQTQVVPYACTHAADGLQVFSPHLSCSNARAAALAAELLQDCSDEVQPQEERSSSLLTQLHIQLLSVVSLSS